MGSYQPHKRVLISNRGEIAIRIAKAASGLGMESVGVYAPVDALALHTRLADEAREIANGAATDPVGAYLDAEALLEIAVETRCDCVHPGYGFLAENAAYAELCAARGIAFIGPSPAALRLFGDKVQARSLAQSLDIPTVPGSREPLDSAGDAQAFGAKLGYPVMLKATAGGGGRGMRAVTDAEAMAGAFERCQSEAEAAFGNGALFVEKLIHRPRHIEVQVLADRYGNTVHLHERDCSVQLRNQKVIEIAPAPRLDNALRARIQADAVKLVQAADYVNAGTVEFLVIPETGEYYFIECNPRIQVEHTVTEQVTGIDLVEAQFRIAAGASLASLGLADQQAVGAPRGFSVQARVVARGGGTLSAYKEPSGPGVRVDANGYVGYTPPPQFDPLLAKVVGTSTSPQREELALAAAIDRTRRALEEFHVGGLATNIAQLKAILAHPAVRAGDARTTLLAEEPALLSSTDSGNGALALLRQQATVMGVSGGARAGSMPVAPTAVALTVPAGHEAVACPMAGAVLEDPCTRGRPGRGWRLAPGHQRHENGVSGRRTVYRHGGGSATPEPGRPGRSRPGVRRHRSRGRRRTNFARGRCGKHLGTAPARRRHHAGIRPQTPCTRLGRSGRRAPTQPRQAHLSGTHRPATRRRIVSRSRQHRGVCLLR